jgi:hypothetical protein
VAAPTLLNVTAACLLCTPIRSPPAPAPAPPPLRFLQGPGTDPESVAELRAAITAGRSCVVQLLNYKRSGDAFVNYLSITPIHDPWGRLTHYVGIQSDISELVAQKRAELAAKHAAVQVRWGRGLCQGAWGRACRRVLMVVVRGRVCGWVDGWGGGG